MSLYLDQQVWNFTQLDFIVSPSWGLPKYIETKVLTIRFYPLKNFFERKKRGLEEVSLAHFLYDFWRKIFLMLYSNWQNWIAWISLLLEILRDMCIDIIICFPVYEVLNFEINLNFFITSFYNMTKKVRTKDDKTKISIRLKYLEIKTSRDLFGRFPFTPLRYSTYF